MRSDGRTYQPRPQSRAQKLLSWMLNGNAVTGRSALKKFGIYRLSAVIKNWRDKGFTIETKMVTRLGRRYGVYKMTGRPDNL